MFAYCNNNPVCHKDEQGTRYCAATSVQRENSADRSTSCQHQNQISRGEILRDVTEEISIALTEAANSARVYSALTSYLLGNNAASLGAVYLRFYSLVNHEAPWDIKRPIPWETTIGTEFPGYNAEVVFGGVVMTPENLGNYTYGFLGYAFDIPIEHLLAGSYYAAGFPTNGSPLANEVFDWTFVILGYDSAQKAYEKGV